MQFCSYDVVICLDCANVSRLGKFEDIFKNAKHTVNIDHHESNEKFADNNYIYTCSSTCELIYIISKALNWECSKDVLKHCMRGHMESIGSVIAMYGLSFGVLYFLPWLFDLIKSIF